MSAWCIVANIQFSIPKFNSLLGGWRLDAQGNDSKVPVKLKNFCGIDRGQLPLDAISSRQESCTGMVTFQYYRLAHHSMEVLLGCGLGGYKICDKELHLPNQGMLQTGPLKSTFKANIFQRAKKVACMMRCRIILCTAVSLALLTVLLLALISPVPHDKNQSDNSTRPRPRPWLALSLYIQQPQISSSDVQPAVRSEAGAFIFHRKLTEGLENTSRVIGKAQGFIIPIEHFAYSGFNIIYLTFDTPDYSGSLSVQAKHVEHKDREELTVVGGTGSFAFARGLAVFAQTDPQPTDVGGTYHVKLQLQLRFPDRSHSNIPG
ncbi:hypothetical protein Peur_010893 [Populus x canadensis]